MNEQEENSSLPHGEITKIGNKVYTQYNTAEDMLKGVENYIPISDIGQLNLFSRDIRDKNKLYKKQHNEDIPGFKRVIRKIEREIEKRNLYAGSAPQPNTVVRNSFYSTKLLDSMFGDGIIPSMNSGDPILAKEYDAVLSTKEAGFIMDAIGSYVQEYFIANSKNMRLDDKGEFYVIRDTFNNFCSRADISGLNRRLVKEALFPEKGKMGLLEQVSFIIPDNKRQYSLKMRFISARKILSEKRPNRLPNEDESVKAFEIDIHAGLYQFLEQREEILRGKTRLIEGYQMIPLALSSKIDRVMLRLVQTLTEAGYSNLDVSGECRRLTDHIKRRGSIERFRPAVMYTIDKWNTGAQNRKGPMLVHWEELHKKGLFPSHTKKKRGRKADMDVLLRITGSIVMENEAYPGCIEVDINKAMDTLTFMPKNYNTI